MTAYLRPGVFIEETLQPLSDGVGDTSDAVAAFVGTSSKGGPVGPTHISSWSQFQTLFGSIKTNKDPLAYALYSFFNNGGSEAFVVRAVNDDAVAATVTLKDGETVPADVLKATAISPGAWANSTDHGITLTVSNVAGDRFDLLVEVGSGLNRLSAERFSDVSVAPGDARFVLGIVNSPTVGSKYVRLELVGTPTRAPKASENTPLVGGADGTGAPNLADAVALLENIENRNLLVNVAGLTDNSVLNDVINWAENHGSAFVVVDSPKASAGDSATEYASDLTLFAQALSPRSCAAVYGPTVFIHDPASSVSGAIREVAVGGAVVGQYISTDANRGVHKAPAGTSTSLRGVIGTSAKFADSHLESLHAASLNVVRNVPGAGICIMGARTLARGNPDRYVNIRRSLQYINHGLNSLTRFAIFEPNDDRLWGNIYEILSAWLAVQQQQGLVKGSIPAQGFYVKCDGENNDAAAVNAGVVNIEVGVALSSPAEFIIIRIGQYEGGTTTTLDIQGE